jgi:hypothetical protein
VTNLWASRWESHFLPSDKALSESLGEVLLGELFSERQSSGQVAEGATDGKATRQVSCLVREPLGMSLGEYPGELLPKSSRPVTKLLRPIQVPIARDGEENPCYSGLMLVCYTDSYHGRLYIFVFYQLLFPICCYPGLMSVY